MKKTILMSLCALMIVMSGCQSMSQFYGGATGASLGGMLGSAIGGIAGGRHGHNVGTVAGMVIGGAIGVAATTPKTRDGNYSSSDYYDDYNNKSYVNNTTASPFADIAIENLRYYDGNGDNSINPGEHAYLEFEIRNYGRDYVYDIAPVITVTGTKQILLSPTAVVSELAPGKAVRYQADVVATNKLKSGMLDFAISFSDGNTLYTQSSFQIQAIGKK